MLLTDVEIRSAKRRDKSFKLFDSGGLYLEVTPAGGKYWRWKYRFAGKEKRLAFGVYPDVTLKMARDKCDTAVRCRPANHAFTIGWSYRLVVRCTFDLQSARSRARHQCFRVTIKLFRSM